MAGVKGKKELKRCARAKGVRGLKTSGCPKYIKVKRFASPDVRVGLVRGFASTNRALKAHYNPNQVLSEYVEDTHFRHAVDGGIFRKRDEASLAFYSVIAPKNASGGTVLHHHKSTKPAFGHSAHGAYKSRKPASRKISFIVDLEVPDFMDFGGPLPYSFAEALNNLINARGATNESLAEASNLSSKTISRLRNRETDPSRAVVVALCIGLSLDPYTGHELLNRAGKTLPGNKLGRAYDVLIGLAMGIDINEANEMLKKMNLPTLGNDQ